MSTKNAVFLEISCWAGMSIGAEHYYGHLSGYLNGDRDRYEKYQLNKILTARDAKLLNQKDRCDFDLYFEGEETDRFNTEREVIQTALEKWQTLFPGATILFCGSACSADPTKILVAPEPIFTEGNKLFEQAKHIGFWDFNEEKMQEIAKAWDKLFEGAGI